MSLRSLTHILCPTGNVLHWRSKSQCNCVSQKAQCTVVREEPYQLQHGHRTLEILPQPRPTAILNHVFPQQQIICMPPKMTWTRDCRSGHDRGPDQMMLTVLTVFTSIRHYHYFYCYNCVCCCIGFFILVYSLPMCVL